MSTSIDNRIVGLEFDNKNFKKNVDQTLDSLDQLHNKLSMKGASKGLDELEKAAHKCDLSSVSKAADLIQKRFSLMGMFGMRAFNKIADTALSTAHRMVKAFTISPIMDGYKEYELKMGSIQTIIASTGESLGTVNGYLEELNRYSDRTIYSFADMTQNIGKFTNAGVKLEDAVAAIQGISNEAAVSGANANEASRAMYNFSQALSAGYVKLIDWKSIENANMATREFKQELINTAVAMGTLTKNTDGTYQAGKVAITATKNFNDSLQQQWMTSEVLIETLRRYADETTDIGKKAFAAAQDVKTFSQLMDTLKEAVGSGWAQISEIVLGDLDEAKQLWTSVNNVVSKGIDTIFGGLTGFLRRNLSSEYKNFLAEGPIASMSEFDAAMQKATEDRKQQIQETIDQNNSIIEAHKELAIANAKYQDYLNNGKTWIDDKGRKHWWMKKPKELETTHEAMFELNKQNEELNKQLKDESLNVEDVKTGLLSYLDAELSLTAEQRARKGINNELYQQMREFKKGLEDGTVDVQAMVDAWTGLSPRVKLIKALGNSLKLFGSYLTPIKEAFSEVFFGKDYDPEWLKKSIDRFYEFSKTLQTNSKWVSTLKNVSLELFGVFKNGLTFTKDLGSKMMPYLSDAFAYVSQKSEKLLASFAKISSYIRNNVDIVDVGTHAYKLFSKVLKQIQSPIRRVLSSFSSTNFATAFKSIGDVFRAFYEDTFYNKKYTSVDDWVNGLKESFKKVGKIISDAIDDSIKSVKDGFNEFKDKIKESLGKIDLVVSEKLDKIKESFEKFKTGLEKVMTFLNEKLGIQLPDLFEMGFLAASAYTISRFGKATGKTVKMMAKITDAAIKVTDSVASVISASAGLITGIKTSMDIIARGIAADLKADAFKRVSEGMLVLSGAVAALVGSMWLLTKVLKPEEIQESMSWIFGLMVGLTMLAVAASQFAGKQGALSLSALGASVLAIAAAAYVLSKIKFSSTNDIYNTIAMLTLAMSAMVGLATLAGVLNTKAIDIVKGSGAIIAIAGSLVLLTFAFKMIAAMDLSAIISGIKNLFTVFGLVAGLMLLTKLAGENAWSAGVGLLAVSAALLIIVPLITMLSLIPIKTVLKAVSRLSLIFLAFSILFDATATAGPHAHKAAITVLAMAAALIPIALVVTFLGALPFELAAKGVAALAGIMFSFSLVIKATEKAAGNFRSIVALTVMAASLGVVVAALAYFGKYTSDLLKAGLGLAAVMLAISGFVYVLDKTKLSMGAIGKMYALVGIIALLVLVIAGLSAIPDPDTAIKMVTTLGGLLLELVLVLGVLTIVGKAVTVGATLQGLLGLIAIIGTFGLILAGLGGLATSWSNAEEFINRGIPLLRAIGEGIGQLVGGALGGLVGGTLISIGNALSDFTTSLEPFIAAMGDLPEGLGTNVKDLAVAILAMTGADVLGALTGILNLTGMSAFATNMESYGNGVASFAKSVSGIDDSALAKAKTAAEIGKVLADMSKEIPEEGGFLNWITGEQDLSKWALDLAAFGSGISELSLKTGDVNLEKIDALAASGTKLADMAKHIPNTGGLLGRIMGNNDADTFGKSLEGFGTSMAALSKSGLEVDSTGVENVAKAGERLVQMAESIPNTGGKWAKFWGDNAADSFGKQLEVFGYTVWQLGKFGENINLETFDIMISATEKLVNVASLIKGVKLTGAEAKNFQNVMGKYVGWLNSLTPEEGLGDTSGLTGMLDSLIAILSGKSGEFQSAGTEMMKSFVNGMLSYRGHVMSKASSLAYSAVSKLRKYNEAKTAGDNIAQGFIDGMESRYSDVYKEGVRIGEAAVQGINDGGQMASPSRATRKSGRWIGAGFILGMQDMVRDISHTGVQLGESSVDAINDAIHRVSSVLSSDVNLQPVIRPVMDLSEIQNGTSEIAAMYNRKQVAIVAYGKHKADTYRMPVEAGSTNTPGESVFNFTQNNYSPKSLRSIDIYRKTKNQLSVAEGVLARRVK